MVVTNGRRQLLAVVLWFVLQGRVHAKTSVSFVLNYMQQTSMNGGQVAGDSGNEEMLLFEPTLFIDSKISPQTNLNAMVVYDSYSTASAQLLYAETGASGAGAKGVKPKLGKEWEYRTGVSTGFSHRMGTWTVAPRVGYSEAVPYISRNGGLSVEKTFKQETYTLSASYNAFRDRVLGFSYNQGVLTDWEDRNTDTYQMSFGAVVSPVDVALIGYTTTMQKGVLSTNMNSVRVDGLRQNEVLPPERSRNSITLRHVHAFTSVVAGQANYRYYFDGWGIKAHTAEPSIMFSFADDDGLLRFSYRYHTQTATKYFQDSFARELNYMTSDSDLAKLVSQEVAGQVSYTFDSPTSLFETMDTGAGLAYYKRSNGLTVAASQANIGVTF